MGACAVASCHAGHANCDGNPANGCEVNTQTDVDNCGGCGAVCPAGANSTATCSAGACSATVCQAGYANCDGNVANGCEVNTQTNPSDCGGCGIACSYPNAGAQ